MDRFSAEPATGPAPLFSAVYPDVFDAGECAALRALVDDGISEEAATKAYPNSAEARRTQVAWVPDEPDFAWVWSRMADLTATANREAFNFRLEGFDEQMQVARYGAEKRDHFDWHVDRGRTGIAARRKLSIAIQLSEPSFYTGGALQLFSDGHLWEAPRAPGTAMVFAGFVPHRVTPVETGVRHSLALWVHGPDFV